MFVSKRLSLLGGTSLAAAWLVAGAAIVAPERASAAECSPAGQSGTKTCTGTLADITYPATTGALTLQLGNDLVVSTGGLEVVSPVNDVVINRINTPAVASDPAVVNTSGAGISVLGGAGLVSVNLSDPVTGSGPGINISGTTHGVRLQGGGALSSCGFFCFIDNSPVFTMTNGVVSASASGIGVEVVNTNTASGTAAVNIGGSVSGGTGVRVETNGTGAATVALTAGAQVNGGATGLRTVANGAGDTTFNLTSAQVSGGDVGLRAASAGAGAFAINLRTGASVSGGTGGAIVLERAGALAGNTVISNFSSTIGSMADLDGLAVGLTGGTGSFSYTGGQDGFCIFACFTPEDGDLLGRLDLANTGTSTIAFAGFGRWFTAGENLLGHGATTLNQGADVLIAVSSGGGETELDFGLGADVYNQRGLLVVGGGAEGAATLTLSNLERWNSSKVVLFGAAAGNTASDGVPNDRVVAVSGATPTMFNGVVQFGVPLSRFLMDVDLGGAAQPDCSAAVSGDCLDIRGGETAGETEIVLNTVGSGIAQPNAGIVLVDGSSLADDFYLSPLSTNWAEHVSSPDGVIDTGLFIYDLAYDAAGKRHVLVGLASDEALQLPLLGLAAQTVWSSSANAYFERQVDQRDTMAPGVWLRVSNTYARRDLHQGQDSFGTLIEANNGYRQRTTNIVGGVDLVARTGAFGAVAAGLTAGVLDSEVEFRVSPSEVSLEGHSFGAYASWLAGPFFVDAIVNTNTLDVEYALPSLGAGGTTTTTDLESVGGQVEAGFRLPINDGAAVFEPLVGLSYVKTELGDLALPGGTVSDDDFVSMAGSLGARVSGDLALDAFTLKFGFTGRVWEEFEADNAVALNGAVLRDDFSGTQGDVGLDLGILMGPLSAFVSYAVRFKEDYQSRDAAVGVRYQW